MVVLQAQTELCFCQEDYLIPLTSPLTSTVSLLESKSLLVSLSSVFVLPCTVRLLTWFHKGLDNNNLWQHKRDCTLGPPNLGNTSPRLLVNAIYKSVKCHDLFELNAMPAVQLWL